jgi:hypothetical protein
VSLGIATPEYEGRGGDAGNPQRSVRDLHLLASSGHLQVNSTIAERDSEGRTPRGELKERVLPLNEEERGSSMDAGLHPGAVEGGDDLFPHSTEYEDIDLPSQWQEGDLRRNSQKEEDEDDLEKSDPMPVHGRKIDSPAGHRDRRSGQSSLSAIRARTR